MGTCEYCGTRFPLTRSTRKYCTPRCKTNACLGRKPRRIRAAEVEALHELLHAEVGSAEVFRERLREIIAPHLPPFETEAVVPSLD
jgi:ribosomal protein L24E